MRGTRGQVIRRAFRSIDFVARRRHTTALDLAAELQVSRQTALQYLHEMAQEMPIEIEQVEYRDDLHMPTPQLVFRFSLSWRKQHGFL